MMNLTMKVSIMFSLVALGLSACNDHDADSKYQAMVIEYQCDSGVTFKATYVNHKDKYTAIIKYNGHKQEMINTISASGAKYGNGQYVWWTKGSGNSSSASLYKVNNGKIGQAIEQCSAH